MQSSIHCFNNPTISLADNREFHAYGKINFIDELFKLDLIPFYTFMISWNLTHENYKLEIGVDPS